MGFMDEYRKALEDEKKKKKKNTSTVKYSSIPTADAPVRTTKATTQKADERKWFEKGAFEDGYQFGDVTKTILGSTTDALENIGSGIMNMGETAVDALAWMGNAFAKGQYYQNGGGYNVEQDKLFEELHKESTKATEEFIKKDLYDADKVAKAIISAPMKSLTGIDAETDSVFGEKSDSLVQSGGQLLATIGLQSVGVPWFLTTGATSFGGEAENALKEGATMSEAGASGVASAGGEILSEMLSGGIKFGGKTLDDVLLKPFIRGISNKTARLLANAGIDAVGEGTEEIVSGLFGAIGQKLTYMDDKELNELFTSEEAVESFIGGFVMGGVGNVVQGVKAEKQGVDAVTGLTENEQMVVDKIVNDRIAEKEGKVNWREKNKIYDQVMNDLEKGYISTDDIESVLSGDAYNSWQQHTDRETQLADEIEKLENMPNAEITVKQSEQLKQLREELEAHREQFDSKSFKSTLSEKTMNLVKDTRLAESYNEKARRGQAFEADLTQYDEKQKAVIQKAIDSGILNNTNRTHEFVDMIAKISADKGVLFDFSNNAKLKESGFAVEGKQVNGFVTKDGITLNIDSPKALQSTVGHEITHVLEGTELYDALKTTIFDYAKSKGEYDSRLATLTELYKDVDADVEAELAADLVGDYLFQDYDFVSHLSSANRNVFQKIYDEIKYLYKVATAGSKEARELEKVKRAFEKAYKEGGKAQSDTKYSVSPEADNAYMDAVNRGDTESAQMMVDEAAKAAGYNINAYHGTKDSFTVFEQNRENKYDSGFLGMGFYFTDKRDSAEEYSGWKKGNASGRVLGVALRMNNPLVIEDTKKPHLIAVQEALGLHLTDFGNYLAEPNSFISGYISEVAKKKGYDGIVRYADFYDETTYVVFDAEQIKSTDPVTYDDNGKVIPLSERFKAENNDIRYSLSDSDGKAYAPTFYSQMAKVVDDVKQEKLGAASVVSMLRGKGVKAEEIKWSGIEQFLEGKKSVTKAELQEFIAGSQLQIEEETLDNKEIDYTEEQNAKIAEYTEKHHAIMDELAAEWERVVGSAFPHNRAANINSDDIERDIQMAAATIADNTPEGMRFAELRSKIREMISDNGDFGFDRMAQAYRSLAWNPDNFIRNYDVSEEEANLIREFAEAKQAVEGVRSASKISEQDAHKFKSLAQAANAWSRKASDVRSEHYAEQAKHMTKWGQYKLDGGTNYREYLFKLPGKKYSNAAMEGHWGAERPGVLAHARVQDFDTDNGKMLFIEEIQSDWHNAGAKNGYNNNELYEKLKAVQRKLQAKFFEVEDYSESLTGYAGEWDAVGRTPEGAKLLQEYRELEAENKALDEAYLLAVPDAPYSKNYHEFVLKALLRKAAEDGYTSIGWTTADQQSDRWSDEYAEGYRIEYDQDIPKFLNKYGKKWGAQVSKTDIHAKKLSPDEEADLLFAADALDDGESFIRNAKGAKEVWSMPVTDSMKQSVLYEGQPQYSLSDSEGRELSPAVQKRFGNSKVVDENGDLKVVYHGTATGEFSIFDKSKGSVEGDFGSGFYFTDNEADVSEHYEGGGPDFEQKVALLAERIEIDEDITYDIAKIEARERLYKGSHKFEVYLNIENPAIVGETMLLDNEAYMEQYNEEDYDDYDDYIAEVEQLVADDIERIISDVEWACDVDNMDGISGVLWEAYSEGGIGLEELKEKLNDLYLEDSNGNLVAHEVARQIIESLGYDGIIDPTVSTKFNMDIEEGTTHYIVFKPNQIKAVTNENPTDNPDIHKSLSDIGEKHKEYGRWNIYGRDIKLNKDIAPVAEKATAEKTPVAEMFPDAMSVEDEIARLESEKDRLDNEMAVLLENGAETGEIAKLADEWDTINARLNELEQERQAEEASRLDSLDESEMPPEMDAPITEDAPFENGEVVETDPFKGRDVPYGAEGRKVNAYMYDNPEVKPFFQEEAAMLLWELENGTKGEKWYNDELWYMTNGEKGFGGTKRQQSDSIVELLDSYGMSYEDIEKGLKAIIEDNGAENIAAAKKIEFVINDRLLNGYKPFGPMLEPGTGEPNAEYRRLVENKQRVDSLADDALAPLVEPEQKKPEQKLKKPTQTVDAPVYISKEPGQAKGQTTMFEPPKPNPRVAEVLTEEPKVKKEPSGIGNKLVAALVDKGMAVEKLSNETGNHELQAKYNYALPSNTEARAQYFMEHGAEGVPALKDVLEVVNKSGKKADFFSYLYHAHNIDRMTLSERFEGVDDKAVFGETVTADVSRERVKRFEQNNSEFKKWAEDFYAINKYLRCLMVDGNLISKETANLWQEMYPHYVPIRRVDTTGLNVNVPLDSRKTGVNNPVKRAKGGSSDIQPLDVTMAQRIEQTFRAIARNEFGIELKNTLGTTINSQQNKADVDEVIETLEAQEEKLLKPGTQFSEPTFTVFENGERVEFEITPDMFDALKPAGGILGYRNKDMKQAHGAVEKVLTATENVADVRRNLLTVWNPVFAWYRNPIKDIQDVAVNSQHPAKTYANVPTAIYQLATDGKYAIEYHRNGGKSNTYFDSQRNKFKDENNAFKKLIGMPVKWFETAGEFVEEIPRLAEYIASRNEGRSVERSMLDAARVTTNFAAGGDFTKFLNSHGFTFLNASVQGASQHVRNFREAKQEGLKGYVKVLAKYTIAGLPTILLNNLLWDDDEEYEELNDYVKQNYYVIAKTGDGKFVRIPKGRTAAVMGELMNQMENLATGDDVADFGTFFELFMNNIAPNNPLENNILAPIGQVLTNKAWYGGDLVPSRLQDLPAEEQYDESTDSISRWLGENVGGSPYKWNYLIDQYSGGLGDVFLPMLTPEAESGDDSFVGNLLAPWKKELTTDKVLNNKYPGDFYDLKDELDVKANSSKATEEDAMRSMFMSAVSWDMSDLYKQKREVQNSDLSDAEKYEKVREIQEQINALAESGMNGYNDISVTGLYSEVGDRRFNKDAESGKWYEIQPKNSDGTANWYYEMEQKVTKGLGISPAEYWNNRDEYNYAYESPEKYQLARAMGGYSAYKGYTKSLYDIKADKDENGKSISGSRKEKVIDYINTLDADYGEKIILFKSEYPADDTYNNDIIEYLNGRDDISYEEMVTILKALDFEVSANGYVSW
jgi:hypothetical protein